VNPPPQPARILMSADTVGGVWTYAIELACALGEQDIEVALATMGAPLSPRQQAEARALPRLQLIESAFRLEWMEDPWDDVDRAGRWLLDLEREFRPDFVHLNTMAHGALPFRAPKLVAGHSCVLSWWQAVHGEPAPRDWEYYTRRVRQGLRGAHVVVAPSDALLNALDKHYGPLPVRVHIPNGRDPARFPPGEKENFILTAGRLWDQAKNAAALDEAAASLPWPVYAAGSHQPQFRRLIPLGAQSPARLARWMGRAAIYALPARYEPFGLSALEAALAGCALVLGDIPSLREIWGPAAAYVAPEDTRALAAALELFIEDDCLRQDFSRRARARALEFTAERMANRYVAAYGLASCINLSRAA
jgi:glycogen(starch) synthase